MLLKIAERQMPPDITVVELTGKLALGRESQRIETLVDELAKRGALRVIFDMTGIDYVDSAGIGLLALATGKLREAGGSLALVAPEGRVLQTDRRPRDRRDFGLPRYRRAGRRDRPGCGYRHRRRAAGVRIGQDSAFVSYLRRDRRAGSLSRRSTDPPGVRRADAPSGRLSKRGEARFVATGLTVPKV